MKGKAAVNSNGCKQIPSTVRRVTKMSRETLSHHKLEHAPLKRVAMIKEIKVKHEWNDICLCVFAKFTKLPLNQSEVRAEDLFDLIHIDTWGPYKVSYKENFKYFLTLIDD